MSPHIPSMHGDLAHDGQTFARAGFMNPGLGPGGLSVGPSMPVFNRGAQIQLTDDQKNAMASIQRGEMVGDVSQILMHLGQTMDQLQRGITSSMTAFPKRENLEAPARVLFPLDTPVRNKLARKPGSGTASAWKQLTSMGGGWAAGDQGGEGPGALQAFYSESGAPVEHTSVYADKSSGYKLLGAFGKVTGFAAAAGANFQAQVATEKTNAIRNLMLNEENALINGNSATIAAPWGDGVTSFAFDGLNVLTSVANGTPAAQIQAAVGALTQTHIDNQLTRLWKQGATNLWMLMNAIEIQSLVHLAEAAGSLIRIQATSNGESVLGVKVTGYVHPISGELVDIMPSRFQTAGTILYGSDTLPDGSNTLEVEVLPQVELPELAPHEMVQGYVAKELAPTLTAPDVYPFMVSVYETLKMISALHFAKSSGVTAV